MYDDYFERCGPRLYECIALSLNWRGMKITEIIDQDIG
jgi:hypothetical protein